MELMDTKTLLKKFIEFFEEYKSKEIKKAIHEEIPFLTVCFFEISEFDIELSDQILSFPEDLIKIMEEALKEFYEDEENPKPIKIRFTSLPATEKLMIRDIRSEHIGKLVIVEGLVRRKTDVRPRLRFLDYLCTNPSCNYSEEKIRIPQLDDKARILKNCPKCKSGIELINKDLIDSQSLILEEIPEHLDNSADQPKRINILLQGDLVSPFKDAKTNPGARVYVIGIVREVPLETRTGSESVNYDILIEGNFIDLTEDDYAEIEISKEEEKQIKELAAKNDIVEILVKNTAPSIHGNNKIKEAIILQLFGGAGGTKGDGIKTRGDIHILLIGDPGAAKSQLLKAATKVAPKSSFVSGKSATGAGLCVAPNSTIVTNFGEMQTIENIVENNFSEKKSLYKPGIWKEDNIKNVKIQSLSNELKIHSKNPQSIWKLESPKKVFKIILSSGKSIELTANTQLFTINKGKTFWKKSSELKIGEYVACPRKLYNEDSNKNNTTNNSNIPYICDLIKSNPQVYDIEEFIKEIIEKLRIKYETLRNAGKILDINENKLYSSWISKKFNGCITLEELKKISNETNSNYKNKIKKLSLFNGKYIFIPSKLDKELIYLTGLIAGDGDIRKTEKNSYSIRFSNSNENLNSIFKNIIEKKFKLNLDIQEENEKRPKSSRTTSKILAEILFELGIPISPKSNKIEMSNILLKLPNKILSEYIAGIFDSDGSVSSRNSGSDCVEIISCSEKLIKQLQLVLLRFEIHSKIRVRPASQGKIKGNFPKWNLEIRGFEEIKKFAENIKLKHPKKQEKLKEIISKKLNSNTNVDIIPEISYKLKEILNENKISLKSVRWHENYSRKTLIETLEKIKDKIKVKKEEFLEIEKIANSDIFWEKIVDIELKDSEYEFVYDLTVEDSHNFVVDGILVHNTATVMKDELTKGWALEAGAIVLASGGLCAIDELDKMSEEDTSAMHEALEQQCYHYDFEIQFADGSSEKIGDYVENLFEKNKNKIKKGINCEILEIESKKLLTTDFNKIFEIVPQKVSRHIKPKEYYKISFQNGRNMVVTPEHPIFVYSENYENKFKEISAEKVELNSYVPAPKIIKIKGKKQILKKSNFEKLKFLNEDFSFFLGFFGSEGHSYKNIQNRTHEIGVSNTNESLIKYIKNIFEEKFEIKTSINIQKKENREKAKKDLLTLRILSKEFYNLFENNFKEFLNKAPNKRIPNIIKKSQDKIKKIFLYSYFLGDGFFDSERIGFSTSSYDMACDLSDILLNLGIYSYISKESREEKKYYKVVINKQDSLKKFKEIIEKNSHFNKEFEKEKIDKISEFLKRSKNKNTSNNLIPKDFLIKFNEFIKKLNISDGTFTTLIKRNQNSNDLIIKKYLKKAKIKIKTINDENLKKEYYFFENFINSDIRLIKITKIEKIIDNSKEWVYDVTVPPNKTFISQGLVLHNTISIAKANIRATLKCQTTVLGAANPKFGRFDPYGDIGKQINFPPALISRFDLIFILRDIPDKKKDDLIAEHILQSHKDKTKTITEIKSEFLKKYIAFAKNIKPVLTPEAIVRIKDFYVQIRNASGGEETGIKSVPVTARQLEAIVRLSEAYAKIKLDNVVKEEYAIKAIDMLMYCLEKIGIDPKTGEMDIDRITTGVTASSRNLYKVIQAIIDKLEVEKPEIKMEDLLAEAEKQKIEKKELDKVLEKLKVEGIIFEPRKNIFKKLV